MAVIPVLLHRVGNFTTLQDYVDVMLQHQLYKAIDK